MYKRQGHGCTREPGAERTPAGVARGGSKELIGDLVADGFANGERGTNSDPAKGAAAENSPGGRRGPTKGAAGPPGLLDSPGVEATVLAARHRAKARAERAAMIVGEGHRSRGRIFDQRVEIASREAAMKKGAHDALR